MFGKMNSIKTTGGYNSLEKLLEKKPHKFQPNIKGHLKLNNIDKINNI